MQCVHLVKTGKLLNKQIFAFFSVLLSGSLRKLTIKIKFYLTCGDSSAVCKNSPVKGPNKIPDFCNSVTWNEKPQIKGKFKIHLKQSASKIEAARVW